MKNNRREGFFPLVVGAPRTGFTLLIEITRKFYKFTTPRVTNRNELLRHIVYTLGEHVHHAIRNAFEQNGIKEDLIYSPMFHPLIGGPKWIDKKDPKFACFRKYIGIKDQGDLTLITKHPRELMECDTVVHSHYNPCTWFELPDFSTHIKFASLRHPCGALNSAVFSINAVTSEYIQRFFPVKIMIY